ncbi:beta-L-arabinofuranosidase domain-containing protein [Lacticaseibacillus kribbianus]|uniref:beta-L-arabinofuranosidase domain-containing protein n=1 Tax=Lacticaseibacillus kribbianus TaxID=2926292 RepID=UPI001CD624B0|nr:beta-L-arabinofuranosidase domain-containing protein [Lacticaseibacillus kribbianus]
MTETGLHPAMQKLPLGAIHPRGWLKEQLKIQAAGLTGQLFDHWPDVGPDSGWLGGSGESWERGPYYLDGLLPLAYLLDDEALKARATAFVDWALASQQPDGSFGPADNDDWWPRMVMLKVLIQHAEATEDPRVVPFLQRYFAYQLTALPARPLEGWGQARGGENVLCVLWLYQRTQDPALLDLIHLLQAQTLDWAETFTHFPFTRYVHEWDHRSHVVNVAMALKYLGQDAVITDPVKFRDALHQALTVLDQFHGQLNGMFTGDEWLAGTSPSQGTELCAVVELMFSLENLLMTLGDAAFGDRLELVAYNALPAAIAPDWGSHQYDQQVNQVMCTQAARNWTQNGPDANLFGLEPHFGCCTANMHQGWPKFVQHLWLTSDRLGLTAISYAPCEVVSPHLCVTVQGDYPFKNRVTLQLQGDGTRQRLSLRIPAWADAVTATLDGAPLDLTVADGYATLEREWGEATLTLAFAATVTFVHRPQNATGVRYGALLFALPIATTWVPHGEHDTLKDWELWPHSRWQYGIVPRSLGVTEHAVAAQPFDPANPPVTVAVTGRGLLTWGLVGNSAAEPPLSPVPTTEPLEPLTLIPYGAAKLRIAELPTVAD